MFYQVTRQQIIDAARSLNGVKYLHQGRDIETGVDCVGFVGEVLKRVNYPEIIDLDAYSRRPSDETLIKMMRLNLEEIELEKAQNGDIFLMKMFSALPKHVAIKIDALTLIHALSTVSVKRVIDQPIRLWRSQILGAFQIRGVID